MMVPTDGRIADCDVSSPRSKMRLLIQMAETLEDQAAGLYRRVAVAEEEEFMLNREIEERQTEINRLVLKLEAVRAERDSLMEKIDTISGEAIALREEIFNGEDESALSAIDASAGSGEGAAGCNGGQPACTNGDPLSSATFFRRMTLSEQTPHS